MTITSAMPPQKVTPLEAGATSPGNSALIAANKDVENHMALIGKSGGSNKRSNRRQLKGGASGVASSAAPVVQVPSVPGGAVNPEATGANYKALAEVSQQQAGQAVFDTAQNPGDTAKIASEQQAMYKGGSKKRTSKSKSKRGGSWPVWGCLSGGRYSKSKKQSRRKRGKHSRRVNKHKNTKRR